VSEHGVCLSNADARQMLGGIVTAVSAAGVDTVVLTDVSLSWPDGDGRALSPLLGSAGQGLLTLCFCDSCLARAGAAGVNAVAAQSSVRSIIDRALACGRRDDRAVEAAGHDAPALLRYQTWQTGEPSGVIADLARATSCELVVDRGRAGSGGWPLSGDGARPPPAVMTTVGSREELPAALFPGAARNELRAGGGDGASLSGPELVSVATEAAAAGVSAIELDEFGRWPDTAFAAMRQAIRFARRSAET
jgi:hypothetical protein